MRLIDADNLKIPNDAPYKASVKRVVAMQPTVEAREVVHGKWVYDENANDWGIGGWRCSECGCKNITSHREVDGLHCITADFDCYGRKEIQVTKYLTDYGWFSVKFNGYYLV